jgi:hypothetical protein
MAPNTRKRRLVHDHNRADPPAKRLKNLDSRHASNQRLWSRSIHYSLPPSSYCHTPRSSPELDTPESSPEPDFERLCNSSIDEGETTYWTLDSGEFRLLRLHPGEREDAIHCSITIHPLSECPTYEAWDGPISP